MQNERRIDRRSFLGHCLAASGTALATDALAQVNRGQSRRKGKSVRHRNILLLISDDHGLDQSGCYGNDKIKTPHLDAMAKDGVRFTNAFAIAASCSASRGTILTGLYTHDNGQYGLQHSFHHFSLHRWVETLPALLKKNGYKTGIIGKLHVAPEEQLPFDYAVQSGEIMGNRDVKTMADKAGEFFSQTKNAPFFLLIGYSDPHRSSKGFGNDRQYPGVEATTYDPADVTVPAFLPDTPEAREELADMYQAVTRMDAGIGMVIEKLRASNRYDDTLIIYISDNGIPFPGAKTTIYDPGVHLPMIVCSPDLEQGGSVNRAMISFIDLVPTILDWTGTEGPEYELPGKSFRPILNQENPHGWDEVYQSHTFHEITMYYPMRSVRTRRYRYILNLFPELEYPFATDLFASKTWQGILKRKHKMMGKRKVHDYLHRPAEELFDLEKDPDEVNNVAGDSRYRDVLEEMRAKLTAMRKQTKDPWLVWENYSSNRSF